MVCGGRCSSGLSFQAGSTWSKDFCGYDDVVFPGGCAIVLGKPFLDDTEEILVDGRLSNGDLLQLVGYSFQIILYTVTLGMSGIK